MDSHAHWLLTTGRFAPNTAALLSGLAKRLCDDGFDLLRINVQPRALHSEIDFMLHIWRPSEVPGEFSRNAQILDRAHAQVDFGIVQEIAFARGGDQTPAFRASPLYAVHHGAPRVRARVVANAAEYEFPILRDLAAAGATDYAAWPLHLSDKTISTVSFVTKKPGGLTDDDLAKLEAMLDVLAMCIEPHLRSYVARSLLHTYLGRGAGEAVLAGRVARGDVERMEAAIWFSDLRGFTQASTTIEPRELVAWLNDYFEAIAKPIAQHDGEILKFIGDAVLAVFPVTTERSRAAACEAAMRAASAANAELDLLNAKRAERGLPALAHGIGLHVGEVQYGNIGAPRRLDFTVIGQAVNLASRIESLCGKLGRRTLASADVAALVEGFSRVGTFELKGIPGEHDVFGL